MARFSALYGVDIIDAHADARAKFDIGDKFDLEGPGAAFSEMTIAVKIVSPASSAAVESLMSHAERACHTSNSLRALVPVEIDYQLEPPGPGEPL